MLAPPKFVQALCIIFSTKLGQIANCSTTELFLHLHDVLSLGILKL